MAVLVLLLSLATVSPALHEVLHGNEDCEHHCESHQEDSPDSGENAHICAVTILDTGATAPVIIQLPTRIDTVLTSVSISAESIWSGQAPLRQSARAPPTVNVV